MTATRYIIHEVVGLCWIFASCHVFAESPSTSTALTERTTEAIVSEIGQSIVTIRAADRDGKEYGLGTGFVIDANGLIATNFHVISEGRPLKVTLWPNKLLKVLAVEASSRNDDLAILRVDPGEHILVPLKLSDDVSIAQGVSVLAFGNPLGLRHSVVQGVVSAIREVEHRQLIQLAIPIEPGNSGGPLVDLDVNVRGIINMKSAIAKNVGFAIPIARLKSLMQSPNPIAIDRWVRLAGIDTKRWTILQGGQWQERSGVISVSGSGHGFGGRILCLNQQAVPKDSFEVAVDVKLDDESGAAGLVFHADGGDRHYGFYPSNRKLRLTCFNGPNVLNWEVIKDVASQHYLLDDWNRLKVRVVGKQIECFVNGYKILEVMHSELSKGQVGLAAFRGTGAEFRRFRIAEDLHESQLDEATHRSIADLAERRIEIDLLDEDAIAGLSSDSNAAARELVRQAELLSRRAEGLKRIAEDVHLVPVLKRLSKWQETADKGDLLVGGLLVAALAHPDIDVDRYVDRVNQMAVEIQQSLPEKANDEQMMMAINRYLFDENGFHGGQDEFYHQANNQLDRVIDDREGMPITLCVLYMELGRRLGLSFEGVGLPGRFVVRYRSSQGETQLIDVYEKAELLSDTEVAMMVMMHSQRLTVEEDLRSQSPIEILTRILRNLIGSAEQAGDIESMRRYTEGLVAIHPETPDFRWMRGLMRYQSDRLGMAAQDLDWLIENQSEGVDLDRVIKLRMQIDRELAERGNR